MDSATFIIVFLEGFALGIFFFGGLWYSVKKAVASTKPMLWTLGSFIIRMSLTVWVFYLSGGEDWHRFLALLTGLMTARLVVFKVTKRIEGTATKMDHEIESR